MKPNALVAVVGFMCAAGFCAATAAQAVPSPDIIGPIAQNAPAGDPSHDYTFLTPSEDLGEYGFVQQEFFQQGTANSYTTTTEPLGGTGTIASSGHPYKTRIVVRRPASPRDFNGTVLLEWQNVTAGYDIDAHWGVGWKHFVDQGYAWVGVSAQRVGVHGASAAPNAPPDTPPPANNGLIAWSPTRYGTLDVTAGGTVTDDSLCYDIFSQAAQAIRSPQGVRPLGRLRVQRIIAMGASQSAGRLSTYHNAIHPLHNAVDAFYLLVGGAGLRTDLTVKVFQYLSETDLSRGPTRRMADSDHFRSWEVAGAAHSSYYSDVYRSPLVLRDFGIDPWPAECDLPPYSRVRGYHVIDAQYDLLVRWLVTGEAPPTAPKIEFTAGEMPAIVRDEHGNALGGIRLPEIEAPTALQSGVNSGATFCSLYGTYQPFDAATLHELYPSHRSYVRAVRESAQRNVRAGYLQRDAAWEMIWEAARSDVPPELPAAQ
ncbi:MAG TPA: alpha/beta hydrolase domain-containing protein [Polyangiales bacterium]|nr:alpha/beta hydrolase domain-containing protein [Polyangiales bacterium]